MSLWPTPTHQPRKQSAHLRLALPSCFHHRHRKGRLFARSLFRVRSLPGDAGLGQVEIQIFRVGRSRPVRVWLFPVFALELTVMHGRQIEPGAEKLEYEPYPWEGYEARKAGAELAASNRVPLQDWKPKTARQSRYCTG